jgi:hypothetical protein
MAEAQTCTELVAPGRAVHIFVKLAIQIALYAALFQPADRTARFTTGFD